MTNLNSERLTKFQDRLLQELQDSKFAVAYLNAALVDEDPRVFLAAIKDVVSAQSSMSAIATKTNLNRENLYRMLSENGNPKITSITQVLQALGLKLSIDFAKASLQESKA